MSDQDINLVHEIKHEVERIQSIVGSQDLTVKDYHILLAIKNLLEGVE